MSRKKTLNLSFFVHLTKWIPHDKRNLQTNSFKAITHHSLPRTIRSDGSEICVTFSLNWVTKIVTVTSIKPPETLPHVTSTTAANWGRLTANHTLEPKWKQITASGDKLSRDTLNWCQLVTWRRTRPAPSPLSAGGRHCSEWRAICIVGGTRRPATEIAGRGGDREEEEGRGKRREGRGWVSFGAGRDRGRLVAVSPDHPSRRGGTERSRQWPPAAPDRPDMAAIRPRRTAEKRPHDWRSCCQVSWEHEGKKPNVFMYPAAEDYN